MPSVPRIALYLPQGHEDSEYVVSLDILQREGGFYSARTDGRTEAPSTALVYRLYLFIVSYNSSKYHMKVQ